MLLLDIRPDHGGFVGNRFSPRSMTARTHMAVLEILGRGNCTKSIAPILMNSAVAWRAKNDAVQCGAQPGMQTVLRVAALVGHDMVTIFTEVGKIIATNRTQPSLTKP